jgi:NADH:ubiquinone oxidoreductase subunit C
MRNPVEEIYDLFKKLRGNDIDFISLLNEYDVIQGKKVILDRLEEVYHLLGLEVPDNIQLKKYQIMVY